jgi:hypothetical protein
MECAGCRKVLREGLNVVAVQHAVLGPNGIVPLEEATVYCSETCAGRDLAPDDRRVMPARRP